MSGFIALALMFFTILSYGKSDLSFSAGARSYPFGGSLELDFGKSLMLWGTRHEREEERSPWYGHTRVGLRMSTAGTYNAGLAKLEVHPLSILGLAIGREIVKNDKNYSGYNCSSNRCLGHFSNSFGEVSLTLGYQNFFLVGQYRLASISADKKDMATFIEPKQGLQALSEGDQLFQIKKILGVKLSKNWILAYNGQYAKMKKHRGVSRTNTLNILYKVGKWSFAVGGGVFSSSLREEDVTINLFVHREFLSSLAL